MRCRWWFDAARSVPRRWTRADKGTSRLRAPLHNPSTMGQHAALDVGLLNSTGGVSSAGTPATMLDGGTAASVRGTACVERV